MLWLCSICGRKNPSTISVCPSCGNTAEDLPDSSEAERGDPYLSDDAGSGAALRDPFSVDSKGGIGGRPKIEKPLTSKTGRSRQDQETGNEFLIKEVNAWKYVYSSADQSIHLTTPALPGFRITLSEDDLQDLLEVIYRNTGARKTTRSLELSNEAVSAIVEQIGGLIEERRAKIRVKLSSEDLQRLGGMINEKLNE